MSNSPQILPRKKIGILTNMMATPFSEGIAFGASDFAKQHGYDSFIFAGSELDNPDPLSMSRHRVFDFVKSQNLAGLILPLGSLSRFISPERQRQFIHDMGDIPAVTITSDWVPNRNISYSPNHGMQQIVAHLINVHGIRRFAYVGGTGHHVASIIKQKNFFSALQQHGVAFDPAMYLTSDMKRNAQIPQLDALFASDRAKWPQAVVAGTDNQAVSILLRLRLLGIRVPDDVIVTGSGGGIDSLFSAPPLTTILEPTYDLGWQAGARLHQILNGEEPTEPSVLPTTIRIAQSCGCNAPGSRIAPPPTLTRVPLNYSEALEHLNEALVQSIAIAPAHARANAAPNLTRELGELLIRQLNEPHTNCLLTVFDRQLERNVQEDDIRLWGQFAQKINDYLMDRLANGQGGSAHANLAKNLVQIVQVCNERAIQYHSHEADKFVGMMREISIQLNSEFDITTIGQILWRDLKISDCYIGLFDKNDPASGILTNVLAIKNGHPVGDAGQIYPSKNLIPIDAPQDELPRTLIVMPMSFGEEFLGLMVINLGERKGAVYESLLSLFSSGLKNRMQFRDLRDAEEKFSDIAHSASDWLWEIDPQGVFTYCSDGVAQVLGYRSQDVVGKSITHFLAQPTAHSDNLLGTIFASTTFTAVEFVYHHQDGRERTLLAAGKPILREGKTLGYRGAYKDITEVKAQEARILTLAYRDGLTDLPNRALFNDRLSVAMASAQRSQAEFAILFLDLDGFKLVNDSMGHDAGDLLLNAVAKRFLDCVREEDTLARFGGDEFVAILPNIESPLDAARIAERFGRSLDQAIEIREQPIFITPSIGIAIFPGDGKDAETLLKHADKAMYKAKQNGKNRFVFYEQTLEEQTNRAVIVRNLLHNALRNNGFKLVYQPQIRADNGQVIGVEALIRLPHGDNQMVSPMEFIPLAEEIGVIDEIGLWVFKTACAQQRQWADAGCQLSCSINVSAKQLHSTTIADRFLEILQAEGVDPRMLILEVTENAVIDNEHIARKTLQTFSDHGLRIALDDFGTGYASLSCLRKIPVDILKIDRSFIDECATNTESADIVAAIAQMAKSLKLTIVAEGVETKEQAHFIRDLGVDEMQGYYFARPLSADQIIPFAQVHQAVT